MLVPKIAEAVLLQETHNYKPTTLVSYGQFDQVWLLYWELIPKDMLHLK